MGFTQVTTERARLPVRLRSVGVAPSHLGRFELVRKLGAGGMATVWLARTLGAGGFERAVALKRLHPRFARDPRFVAMFLDEARLSACVHHANVVSVKDIVTHEGEFLLVMAYVPGRSVAELLDAAAGQAMTPAVVVAVAVDLLAGLHAAHEAISLDDAPLSIIHRDVSPQNVMVGRDGLARVLDFGIASGAQTLAQDDRGRSGKPAYMAPEQLLGDALDRTVDLFSAAAVLWRMLTGTAPFAGTRSAERLANMERGPARPRDRRDGEAESNALLDVLARALAYDRAARPPTAAAFARELRMACSPAAPEQVSRWLDGLAPGPIAAPSRERLLGSQLEADTEVSPAPLQSYKRVRAEAWNESGQLPRHPSRSRLNFGGGAMETRKNAAARLTITERTRVTDSGRRHEDRVLAVWQGGSTYRLCNVGDALVVGRGAECGLRIEHASVSRRHAVITLEATGWSVEDLGSQNGTWFGDERIAKGTVVRSGGGVSVRIGEAVVFVQRAPRASKRRGRPSGSGEVERVLDFIAVGEISILILGETGVGKRRLAQNIHAASARRAGPFVRVSGSSPWDGDVERVDVAQVAGASAAGSLGRSRFFEAASGGSLLLEDVGDLSPSAQARLLRALEHEDEAVNGASLGATPSVRLLASSQHDLEARVREGSFRADLYHRLAGYTVTVPPLRDRSEDIALFAKRFAEAASDAQGLPHPKLEPDVLALLKKYAWPGNLRELRNVMECAVLLTLDGIVRVDVLPSRITSARRESQPPSGASESVNPSTKLRGELSAIERRRILEALERCAGNQTRAAALLGIGRRTLLKRLDEYQLSRPRRRARSTE